MDILASSLEERLPNLSRALVLVSVYGCEPCVALHAAMQNVRSRWPEIEFLVTYCDRRKDADCAFLERKGVTVFPTVWMVNAGHVIDVSSSIRRATASQARADLEVELDRWTSVQR